MYISGKSLETSQVFLMNHSCFAYCEHKGGDTNEEKR
jgi:hypothetical protein